MVFIERFDSATRCHVQTMKKAKTVRSGNTNISPLGISISLFVLLLAITVYNIWSKEHDRRTGSMTASAHSYEASIESYVRALATTNEVLEGFRAAIIYYKRPDMVKEEYCCVGSIFYTPNNGPQIISSGHIFRNDIPITQVLSVRSLNGVMNPEVAYINQIIYSGESSTNSSDTKLDVFIAKLGTTPVTLQPYSKFVSGEWQKNYWGEVPIGSKKIKTLRSILSGEVVDVLGCTKSEVINSMYILINRNSRPGESGTGFVDEYGGIWILHAGPESPTVNSHICEEGRRLTGKNIVGVTTLSGPMFGKYE